MPCSQDEPRQCYSLASAQSERNDTQGTEDRHAHDRCYAATLNDCSSKISREHYISDALLELMGDTVDVAGLRFQETGTVLGLSKKSLIAKVLCERHNNALTALDAEAAYLFDTLRRYDADLRDSVPVSEERVINGADIERWTLKALAGLTQGSLLTSKQLRPESGWLQILFGGRWPTGWGLYLSPDPTPAHAFAGLEILTLTVEDAVWAGRFNFGGFTFQLTLGRPSRREALLYRPAGLDLMRDDAVATKRLTFGWPRRPRTPYQTLVRAAQYDGPRPQDAGLRRV